MNIEKEQLRLTQYVRLYLKNIKKENISQLKSVFCYFSIWTPSPGLYKIRLLKRNILQNLKLFFSTLKGIVAIARQSSFIIVSKNNKKKITKLVVTWAYKNNFLSNGSLQDRFFNTNSRNLKETMWYVIYMDNEIPKKLDDNIILLVNKKFFFKYDLIYLLKVILKNILYNNFSFKKIYHSLSSNITISDLIVDSIKKEIEFKKISKLIVPYEAQPFQRNLINDIKKKNQKIITIGYIHDIMPLPIYYSPLEGLPDILLVHSLDQKKYLINYLKWPKKRIKIISSMRFLKERKNLDGKIFLPHTIVNSKLILEKFENFLIKSKKKSIQKLNIKIHPTSVNIKTQLKLKLQFETIMKKYKDRFSKNKKSKLAIVVGLTSSVVEILENNIKVIHICSEPLFERYSSLFWPSIKVKNLDEKIYLYTIFKKGNALKLGNKSNLLKKYC